AALATAGVVAATSDQAGLPALVTINPGSNTMGVLGRAGNAQIANPTTLRTPGPASLVRVADLNGDGIPDLAVLGPDAGSLAFGNGTGGFSLFDTLAIGSNPTGLAIAELNGHPDLLIGDSQGDVLVLLGDGLGNFQQPREIDQGVALAVAQNSVSSTPALF